MMNPVYILYAAAFLDLCAVQLIIPLLPNHVRNMGGSHLHVGLLGSIYAGFQLMSGPLMGSLSDLKGRKLILMVTLLVCSIAYMLLGLTTSIALILILRAILGIFKQTQMLTKALVPDYEDDEEKQSEIFGKMAAISGLGVTCGPLIGGHIAENDPVQGFTSLAILVGISFAVNAGLVFFLPQTRKSVKRNSSERKSTNRKPSRSFIELLVDSAKQSFIQLFNVEWSKYWDIFMFKVFVGFSMSIYYSNYAMYLKSQYELTPKYIGYVISFQAIITSVSSYLISYINSFYSSDKDYSLRNHHVFLLLSMSLIGIVLSSNVYVYTLFLIPLAIGNAIGRLVTLEMLLNRSRSDHAGTLIGASNSVRSLSGVVAPMVAGVIGEFFDISYVIYVSLLSVLLGLAISFQFINKRMKIE